MRSFSSRVARRFTTAFACLGFVVTPALRAQPPAAGPPAQDAPFFPGETLVYRVRIGSIDIGRGSMRVESSDSIRGRDVVRLGFDIRAGVGPVRVVDRTGSWLDVSRMASLRFFKHERNPLWSRDEKVELYPDERRWRASDGSSGESATDAPLDELSFIYFLRTLNLNEGDTAVTIARHFAADRNPTVLRVRGREAVETRVGTFATILIEMRVTDPRRYRGEGVILVNLSDDACRLPVRVRSAMPVFGTAVLTLESHTHATGVCGAQSDPRDSPR